MKKISYLILAMLALLACKMGKPDTQFLLQYGEWRGVFLTAGGELPFTFRLDQPTPNNYLMTLYNDKETITTKQISFVKDSIVIQFEVYESKLVAKISSGRGDTLIGNWIRTTYDKQIKVPFKAVLGGKYKFAAKNFDLTPYNNTNKWQATFLENDSTKSEALGIFEQQNLNVSGTFLTTTGDYRFLSGIVEGDSLFLSGFDGGSANLFKAKIIDNKTLDGALFFGTNGIKKWSATVNPNYTLPNANTLAFLKKGYDKIDFKFPKNKQTMVSLSDKQYQNKVVVVQILGTWCHNCSDETAFLAPLYNAYKPKGLEVIGLAFERTDDQEKAFDNIEKMKQRHHVSYEILLSGSPKTTQEALPQIEKILGFPTTIVIDKKGKVRRIHTGFSGPSTGEYYAQYTQEFKTFIEQLIKE